MTKQDIIEAYVWIRKNNNTIPDDVLDFMKRSAIDALDSKWIRIDSKRDLPSKNGHYFVLRGKIVEVIEYFDNGKTRGFIRSGSDYINKYNEIGITHYQPIQKPEPPLF